MKKILGLKLTIIMILVWLFFIIPAHATQFSGEVLDYNVGIIIKPNGLIAVEERIKYDYKVKGNKKLQRIIPYKIKNNNKIIKIKISDLEVTDVGGNKIDFINEKNNNEYKITINNDEKLVETYLIKYKVKKALLNLEENKFLNIRWLGLFEASSIKQTKVIVKFPASVDEKDLQAECLSGSTDMKSCVSRRYEFAQKNKVTEIIFIDDKIRVGQKIEFNIQLPSNIFKEKTYIDSISDYWMYLLVVGIVVFVFFYCLRHSCTQKA